MAAPAISAVESYAAVRTPPRSMYRVAAPHACTFPPKSCSIFPESRCFGIQVTGRHAAPPGGGVKIGVQRPSVRTVLGTLCPNSWLSGVPATPVGSRSLRTLIWRTSSRPGGGARGLCWSMDSAGAWIRAIQERHRRCDVFPISTHDAPFRELFHSRRPSWTLDGGGIAHRQAARVAAIQGYLTHKNPPPP